MIKSCPIFNSQSRRALFAHSSQFSAISYGRGSGALARGRGYSLNLEQGRSTPFRFLDLFPGYRGLSCVLQNAPCRMPDVFNHVRPSVWFRSSLIRNIAKAFMHDGHKISVTRTSITIGAQSYE